MTVRARDIMTPHVKSVPQSWTMQHVVRFLTDNEINGSPVCDEDGKIVGIVTLKDVAEFHWNSVDPEVEKQLTPDERQEARRLKQMIFEEMTRVPVEVRDIMTPSVISVTEDTTVREIAELMMKEHLHRVFVTQDERITGIVTTYDMLKVIADPTLTRSSLGDVRA
ncbi:CBS domain-containing protein [Mangrovitalea sediminis]|uniref:CBS domain-containing protein n=1 Tax=Mangrovitalea sediminis TaxID=1982043 RepID=UPI000BE51057|nr:CBS domain-containing protein [Mangrovitalea sediminis]